jgi:hypothetical protein
MIREKLQTLVRQRPFQPFRVHLNDGRVFDVPYRGMTLLAQNFVKIGIPITEGPHPICDHTEYVPLELIDRIEELIDRKPPLAS